MRRRITCLLIAILQAITWYSATSRPFASSPGVDFYQQDQLQYLPELASDLKQGLGKKDGVVYGSEEARGGLSRLGSRPPSCKHKCEGCIPCDAIQIPETTAHVHVQYANYEPEGWKCKCGPSVFNP